MRRLRSIWCRIERNESTLLAIVVRQLGLARDIATAIAADIADPRHGLADALGNAGRAKRIEEKADAIALKRAGRSPNPGQSHDH